MTPSHIEQATHAIQDYRRAQKTLEYVGSVLPILDPLSVVNAYMNLVRDCVVPNDLAAKYARLAFAELVEMLKDEMAMKKKKLDLLNVEMDTLHPQK
jgi:hypothetical protein